MSTRKKKNKKSREIIYEDQVIDLEKERDQRRAKLRAEAAARRKKRGEKSIKEEMMEEIASDYTDTGASDSDEDDPNGTRKKKKRKLPYQLKIVIGVVIVVLIALAFSIGNIISLKMEEKAAREELAALNEEKDALTDEVGDLGSDEYIEEQARDWLKMAKSGEIIYDMKDKSTKAAVTTTSAAEETK